MLVLLSPAKKLDFESKVPFSETTQADFLQDSEKLIAVLQKLNPTKIAALMSISEQLSELNYHRFQEWKLPFNYSETRAAIYSFNGEAYNGLDAYSMSKTELNYAQNHLRILSGLYGLLKPKDAILPYRLEMGTSLKNGSNKNLYEFWNNKITNEVNNALKNQGDDVLVNLASNEYFKAINSKLIQGTIITPTFKEYKNGEYKTIMVFAKKARGMMTRFIITNKINSIDQLKTFNKEQYEYNSSLSKGSNMVFTRG